VVLSKRKYDLKLRKQLGLAKEKVKKKTIVPLLLKGKISKMPLK
jgi:hypothetical protein